MILTMSRTVSFLIQGVVGIVVGGLVLPVGLLALILESNATGSAHLAFTHGVFFLAGGNAALAGCVSLIAARRALPPAWGFVALFVLSFDAVPCYALWASITVDTLLRRTYSTAFALHGGEIAGLGSTVLALCMVAAAYASPDDAPDPGPTKRRRNDDCGCRDLGRPGGFARTASSPAVCCSQRCWPLLLQGV